MKGFSLLELTVTLGLLGLVSLVAMRLLSPLWSHVMRSEMRARRSQSAALALNRLRRDLQGSQPTGVHLSAGQIDVQPLDPSLGPARFLPETRTYRVEQSRLVFLRGTERQLLASEVERLEAQWRGPCLQVRLTFTGGWEAQTSVCLRNSP